MIHAKKVLPEYFKSLQDGSKPFEVRRQDPDEPRFCVGDYLALNEHDGEHYTGRCLLFKITYVLRDFPGLVDDWAVLGLRRGALDFLDLGASSCCTTSSLMLSSVSPDDIE